jgi:hypothetical protein
MYGYNGCYSALAWLAITGDPATLSLSDQKKFNLLPVANDNNKDWNLGYLDLLLGREEPPLA